MNIFVGFGYNENDKWITELVFPLIECLDGNVITGEDLHGDIISQACIERIKNADGVLAFLTKREQMASGKYITHRWVTDELSAAVSNNIPAIEIRDKDVEISGGIYNDRQRITFDIDKKELLLVELVKALSAWRRKFVPKRLFLLPETIVKDVRPFIRNGGVKCQYQFREGNKESPLYETKPFPFGQGLCVDVYNVPADDALIQVSLSGPNLIWSSSFVSVQLLSINLEKE
jgi:hypothetical protein